VQPRKDCAILCRNLWQKGNCFTHLGKKGKGILPLVRQQGVSKKSLSYLVEKGFIKRSEDGEKKGVRGMSIKPIIQEGQVTATKANL